jgi:hypothetical protein
MHGINGHFLGSPKAPVLPDLPATLSSLQAEEQERQEQYKEAVEMKMQAAITLVKLLQIADDKAFVGSYQQLLENRFQSSAQMQNVLMVADVSRDTVIARVNLLNYRRGTGLTPRVSIIIVNITACRSATAFHAFVLGLPNPRSGSKGSNRVLESLEEQTPLGLVMSQLCL